MHLPVVAAAFHDLGNFILLCHFGLSLHSSECACDEIWNSEKCGQMLLASGAGDPDRSLRCQRTPRQMLVVGVIPRVVFSYYANVVPIPRIEVPVRGHTIHVDHMNLWQRWLQKHTRAYTRNMQT